MSKLPPHMVITKHPQGRWTCGRDFAGETVYLIEGDLVDESMAWRLYSIAAAAWRPEIAVKLMLHPIETVRFDALLQRQPDGRRRLTFEFVKLCFEALHPDWEHISPPTSALTSVGV